MQSIEVVPRRRSLEGLISECEALRMRWAAALSRSEALMRRAEECTEHALAARLKSRPRSRYACLEGSLRGGRTSVIIRRDGSVVSSGAIRHRFADVASPAPAIAPADLAALTRPVGTSVTDVRPCPVPSPKVDPLAATITAARCFDRMVRLELVQVSDRLGGDEVHAVASLGTRRQGSDAVELEGPAFFADVTDVDDKHVVRLYGELDIATADFLRATLMKIAGSIVVVDLSDLQFIDAAGVSAIMVARRDITGLGHRFSIAGASEMVRRVFELTDLAHFLDG